MSERTTPQELAAFARYYNSLVAYDPSNPPTRRELAAWAGRSPATVQRWLRILEERGLLNYPVRRRTT